MLRTALVNEAPPSDPYLRVQVRYRGRLGVEVGIFVAVDHLRRAAILTEHEQAQFLDIDDWFQTHLPNPPFYDDGNSLGAVTWFKTPIAAEMSERIDTLRGILTAHGVLHDVVTTTDPGLRIYEDEFQVGIVPYARQEQTALPEGLQMGPTSAGSKRHLAPSSIRS